MADSVERDRDDTNGQGARGAARVVVRVYDAQRKPVASEPGASDLVPTQGDRGRDALAHRNAFRLEGGSPAANQMPEYSCSFRGRPAFVQPFSPSSRIATFS